MCTAWAGSMRRHTGHWLPWLLHGDGVAERERGEHVDGERDGPAVDVHPSPRAVLGGGVEHLDDGAEVAVSDIVNPSDTLTRALRERIAGRPVECAERDRDRYGRIVDVCRVDGADVNAWMVEQGWAVA